MPLLPNIRLQHSDLNWSGNGWINAGTDLNGTPFVVAEQADISLDLSHTDATFYYEVLDNVVDLDLGITARLFDGEASLIGATQQQSMALSMTLYHYSMARQDWDYPALAGTRMWRQTG